MASATTLVIVGHFVSHRSSSLLVPDRGKYQAASALVSDTWIRCV